MKKAIIPFILLLFSLQSFSQEMTVKSPNFHSFKDVKKRVTEVLEKHSSDAAKQHPEYGILPYNAQCSQCVELIDKRTLNTRQFLDPFTPAHTYSQASYFPLHYKKSANDIWRTIDKRLRPDPSTPGVYVAVNQPYPTKCDLNKRSNSIRTGDFEFEFGKNLTAYFFNENVLYSKAEPGDYTNQSIGEEGLLVKNMWKGINMLQTYREGEVETDYVINAPLQLPISKGWLVIEDHFSLPAGYTFEESKAGEHVDNGYYRGDYLLRNDKGDTLAEYKRPVYVDGFAFGMHGFYKLLKNSNDYTLQMMVPVEWLAKPDNTYPLLIDPTVRAVAKIGNFSQSGGVSANLGFTSVALGSCDIQMNNVIVPGESQLTNAYVDVEYQLTFDNTCGNPHELPPYCTFSQVTQEVINDSCGTTTGLLSCHPQHAPFTGTCTTDSNLVPGAHALLINSFNPAFMACTPPQCPDYNLAFTLKNRDSICGDVCGYLCANGHMWQMTIEACQVDGFITQDKTRECAGQPVTFTAHGNCGVPPYHYVWTSDGGRTFDTIHGTPDYVLHPQQSLPSVYCIIIDTCGKTMPTQSNVLADTVIPAPAANAGGPHFVCEGGQVTLGGNPTTAGATIQWTGSDATVSSWLNNNQSPNPVVNIPPGTVQSFYYVLTTTNPSCFRTDTAFITSFPNPVVVADSASATRICASQTVKIAATPGFASYVWNDGKTDSIILENRAGPYYVVVTDNNGCKDTSNSITVTIIGVPDLHVYPDTTIHFGDSVIMTTNVNLSSVSVDSFTWYPLVNISCVTCPNPVVSPLTDQVYGLKVYTGGCSISDSALIKVILPINFFIPNAFTPNGDGNNDNFYIQAQSGVHVFLFQVFNRIGEKVHEGNYPWNGMYKGQPSPPGVYVYVFKLGLYGNDNALYRKGSVTLIR